MSNAPASRRFPLSQHTIGPFFPPRFFQPGDNDLTRVSADAAPTGQGEAFVLRGVVMKEGRIPVPNAILEIWQADSNGRFRHPNDPENEAADPDFLGWGRAWTTVQGTYEFRSVQPGSYVEDGHRRAPHINILVMAAGLMRPVATTLYFPACAEANAQDPVLAVLPEHLRDSLVIQRDGEADGVPAYRFDILLRGPEGEETPFYES